MTLDRTLHRWSGQTLFNALTHRAMHELSLRRWSRENENVREESSPIKHGKMTKNNKKNNKNTKKIRNRNAGI